MRDYEEGNGDNRTQFVFFRQFAAAAGYTLGTARYRDGDTSQGIETGDLNSNSCGADTCSSRPARRPCCATHSTTD